MIDLIPMALALELMNASTDGRTELEHHCLIENAVYEASGEGPKGMALATEVALNRLDAGYRYKDSSCAIVHDSAQFSWTLSPTSDRRQYTQREYEKAAQVVFTYMFTDQERMLPEDTLHYINPQTATDLSWYDEDKVVYRYKSHAFLAGVR
jgi:spore germination cell wall hydrolase CwlJ-like protein